MLSMDTTAFIVTPHAIKVLQSAGYKLASVAECLGQQPYLSTGPPTAVRCSSFFISNNTLIDIFCIRFVGHMVLLNIGLEHFAHHNTLYFLCLSAPFVMFLDVITKLDIWSNVNVPTCELSVECLVLTTPRFDFWIHVQVHRLNGIHRRLAGLCIRYNALFAARLQPDADQRRCFNLGNVHCPAASHSSLLLSQEVDIPRSWVLKM